MVLKYILPLLIIASTFSCKQKSQASQRNSLYKSDFESNWANVAQLESKGLQGSLIQELNFILKKAIEEQNHPIIFKALAIRSKHLLQIEENAEPKIVESFHEAISQSKPIGRSLLQSALAELYQQYHSQFQHQIKDRSSLNDSSRKASNQMSAEELLTLSDQLYLRSVNNIAELNDIPLSEYLDILSLPKADSTYLKHFKVSDFLANRALAHFEFRFDQNQLSEKILAVNSIFSPQKDFLNAELAGACIQSDLKSWVGILTEQLSLIEDEFGLLHYERYRLNTLKKWSTNDSALWLYEKALLNLHKKLKTAEYRDRILADLADLAHQSQQNAIKALAICEKCEIEGSHGFSRCEDLKAEIKQRQVELKMEGVYPINQPLLFALAYKNVEKLYLRLYEMSPKINSNYQMEKEWIASIMNERLSRAWERELKPWKDFQSHQTELMTEGLTHGAFVLIASDRPDFNIDSAHLSAAKFWVSDIDYLIKRNDQKGSLKMYLKDRKHGKALQGAKIKLFHYSDNGQRNNRHWALHSTLTSDENGEARLAASAQVYANYRFEIKHGDQTLISDHGVQVRAARSNPLERSNLQFFSDRKIYQAGQKVQLKGILSKTSGYREEVVPNSTQKISLLDPRGEVLKELEMTTNEFGSFSTSIQLPHKALNGYYRILSAHGSFNFRLEEYRRPSFEITLNQHAETYRLGDSIRLSGTIKSYTGLPINQAKLEYRITQEFNSPVSSPFRSYWPQARPVLIKSGEMQLDDHQFTIDFKSEEMRWRNSPAHYRIEVNAISPLGENVSTEERVLAYALPYRLSADLDESIQLEDLNSLKVMARSTEGRPMKVSGQIELWALKSPQKLSIDKYWGGIDHQLIGEEKYQKLFPFYDYHSQSSLNQLPESKLLSRQAFKSGNTLNAYQQLEDGVYLLRAYSISDQKDTVRWQKRFILFNENSETLPLPSDLWSHLLEDSLVQGENIRLLIGSSFSNLEMLVEIEHQGKIVQSLKVGLDQEQKKLEFNTSDLEGEVLIHLSGMKANRQFIETKRLSVSPSTIPYRLRLITKKDLTRPGEKELWTIAAQNLGEGKKIELLASMYDKSLDQLEDQSWNPFSSLFYRQQIHWVKGFGAHLIMARQVYPRNRSTSFKGDPVLPQLNWFDFRLAWRNPIYFARREAISVSKAEGMPLSQTAEDSQINTGVEANAKKELRTNFSETVFFYPHLTVSDREKSHISFEMPDALTTFKFRALAHDKSMNYRVIQHEVINRKALMVSTYLPSFFRQGDRASLNVKVQNISDSLEVGQLRLQFFDPQNNRRLALLDIGAEKSFSLLPGEELQHRYQFTAPGKIHRIRYRLSAVGKQHTDIEEGYIKILPDRILLSESFAFELGPNESKNLIFDRFERKVDSVDANALYKVEYTADPRWMAVYALPAILSSNQDCPQAVFSNLYARILGRHTANQIDGLSTFIESLSRTEGLAGELASNADLSLIELDNTPWIKAEQKEAAQRNAMASLFKSENMLPKLHEELSLLKALQLPSGAWPWFKGMKENRYLSQYILAGLEKLNALNAFDDQKIESLLSDMIEKARGYVDQKMEEDYRRLSERGIDPEKDYLSASVIQALYSRSFDKQWGNSSAVSFYLEECRQHWQNKNPMIKALIGLSFYQNEPQSQLINRIYTSLRDIAIEDSSGAHWKFHRNGPYWYHSSIEAQAYLIDFFKKRETEDEFMNQMKKWLLHQKNQQIWDNPKTSSEACYALLEGATELSYDIGKSKLTVGKEVVNRPDNGLPASISKSWAKEEISRNLAKIKVNQGEDHLGWGAAHWQYFEPMSKAKSFSKKGLQIKSSYYRYDAKTRKLEAINPDLEQGDLIKHRLTIKVDYDLEFVQVIDNPPACLQTIAQRSGMSHQDGLHYYLNIKSEERQWFIERLGKGTYVLETDYRVSHSGKFSGGISRIQCMYAPEFVAYDNAGNLEIGP